MNIQNIVALATQLKGLGFDEMGSVLLKHICFKPAKFLLSSKLQKGNEQMSVELYFERDKKTGDYVLKFYDAILQKESLSVNIEVNGINIGELEKTMSSIDWKVSFDMNARRQWNAENKSSWQTEATIEEIVESLEKLESSEDGKIAANVLKSKYWAVISYAENIVSLNGSKSKQDVSQRFYLFEGEPGISVDEAYRFLQNRWLEKQMLVKKKQQDNDDETEGEQSNTSSGNGLLKKKRLSNARNNKRNKSSQD